jgi:putative transposase
VNTGIESWIPKVGVNRACRAHGLSPRTWRHRRQKEQDRLPARPSRARPASEHLSVPWKIPDGDREQIRDVLCSDRFCDLAPAQVYATLLDDGVYLCSETTMYRVLREFALVGERRRGHHRHTAYDPPRLLANGPNEVWTWDISRLAGPAPRVWFYLYVILDIYSRAIVGWAIDTKENSKVAHRLINTTCKRHDIGVGQIKLHSDRGAQMTSTTIAELLEDLGVTRSLSRPRTSNDNPYSEANFKTVKYRPDYPQRFETIEAAQTWMGGFVDWYNNEHYHSGIGYLHPADVHNGTAAGIITARQAVLDQAFAEHPARFRHRPPTATAPPDQAWINNPTVQTKT